MRKKWLYPVAVLTAGLAICLTSCKSLSGKMQKSSATTPTSLLSTSTTVQAKATTDSTVAKADGAPETSPDDTVRPADRDEPASSGIDSSYASQTITGRDATTTTVGKTAADKKTTKSVSNGTQVTAIGKTTASVTSETTIPANAAKLTVNTVSAAPGETVNLTVKVENNPGIVAMRLAVHYDKNRLELKKSVSNQLFKSGSFRTNNVGDNPFYLYWFDATHKDYTDNGVFCTLTFVVKDAATAGKAAVSLQLDTPKDICNYDLKAVPFYFADGGIQVTK